MISTITAASATTVSLKTRHQSLVRNFAKCLLIFKFFSLSLSSKFAHTHTYPFNGPFSGTTRVSRYQKGKTNLDFTEARVSEWQWHQLGNMQVCSLHLAPDR